MIQFIVGQFGALGIFITLLLETGAFLFPLPGDTLLFASGILVEAGYISLSLALTASIVGSVLGGHLGYFIGKKTGKKILTSNKFFPIDEAHIEKTEIFFKKYGPAAIIFSRFVPIVRTFISPYLGIIGYNRYSFAFYNLLASLMWTTTLIWLGITIGKFFPNLIKYTEYIVLTALLIFILPAVYTIINKKIK